MTRPSRAHPLARWSLPMAIGTLAVLSVLPLRFLGWSRWFSEQSFVILAPIAHPITRATDLIIPSPRTGSEGTERERTLRDEIERARVRLLQSEQRNAELESRVAELSRVSPGALLRPDLEVSQLPRQVVGEAGEMLVVRAGTNDNIYRGAVITAQSVQLVGRVADADPRTCRVLPINAKGANKILGIVVLDEQTGRRAACLLEPAGDGTMVGEVSPPDDGRADEITVGQTVRLFDDQWPRHAQMLVIGEITRVEPSADQPLRRRITVTPRVNLRRPGEVIVRLPFSGGRAAGTGGGG